MDRSLELSADFLNLLLLLLELQLHFLQVFVHLYFALVLSLLEMLNLDIGFL